jgi:hypothetical protein
MPITERQTDLAKTLRRERHRPRTWESHHTAPNPGTDSPEVFGKFTANGTTRSAESSHYRFCFRDA